MIKTCPVCGKDFNARNDNRIFCSRHCQAKSLYERKKQQRRQKSWFAREWQAWKRDFAAGNTVSNL